VRPSERFAGRDDKAAFLDVPTVRIDSIVGSGERVSFMKVDVEGAAFPRLDPVGEAGSVIPRSLGTRSART
jgi:hypothetical protein